ncbi:hypothetical protein T265_11196 [Opisthorchis viverrini]|uniref:Uncharacterized protein n=1 Tax=Opisthorchis viverrini TaxID=6198 RepID=A0A074YZW6_OPIVI|nr:hypothetical protein T265_11196 [Opisthorchis viverrini]KER20198.1 hypothetical protein T265_11196 [Opisthorchis viverrini]
MDSYPRGERNHQNRSPAACARGENPGVLLKYGRVYARIEKEEQSTNRTKDKCSFVVQPKDPNGPPDREQPCSKLFALLLT